MRITLFAALTLTAWIKLFCFHTTVSADSCQPIRTFADGKQPLREFFVSPTGSDDTGTGTKAMPFRSTGRALQSIRAGDALRLLPGTYPSGIFIADLAGTADAPISVGGLPGQTRPVIAGGSGGIHLSRVKHIVLENLEVTGAKGNGINCDDGGDVANPTATQHVLFRNLYIHDIGTGGNQDGLKLSGVNDFFVLDCEFARISEGGSGIDHVGCHRGLIARCSFTEAGNSIQCKGGSADIEIRWNRFVNGGGRAINIGGSTGFQFFRPPLSKEHANAESTNIRVIANLFRGSDAPVAFVGTVNSLVANNTIIEPARWIIRILQETVSKADYNFLPSGNNRFVNNLIYYSRSRIADIVNIGPNTDPESFEFANNLWFAFDRPERSRPSLPSAETESIYGIAPQFRDAAAGDFTLPPESPGAGKGVTIPALRADLLERCYADPPSVGAFEARSPKRSL